MPNFGPKELLLLSQRDPSNRSAVDNHNLLHSRLGLGAWWSIRNLPSSSSGKALIQRRCYHRVPTHSTLPIRRTSNDLKKGLQGACQSVVHVIGI
jgi:hypothetical protein